MSASIRIAVPHDAAAIVALLADVFAEQRPDFTDAAFAASTPTAEAMVQRIATERVWVAEREGRIVGTISAERQPPSLWIRSLAVDPRMRGDGIAARLLAAAEHHARDLGLGRLGLDTTPFQVAAAKVYERFGFRPTHHHTAYGTPMIQMIKPLVDGDQDDQDDQGGRSR